jgi:serine/threonine protein kinase
MPFEPGTTRLGPYESSRRLARAAWATSTARETPGSIVRSPSRSSPTRSPLIESRQRFEHEARAIAALNDPHICTIHDVGRHGELDHLVLEYLDGDAGDHRADIFAFGCVLYEMLAGRKAFEGASVVSVIAAIMNSQPPPIAALQSAQPLLDHVQGRCLDKDRERRWQSIRDVAAALRFVVEHPIAAPAAAAPRPRRVGRMT